MSGVRPARSSLASVGVNVTVAVTLVTLVSFALPNDPIAQATRVLGPLVVLGAFAASFVRGQPSLPQRIGIMLSLGFVVVVPLVAVVAILLPHLGVSHPLAAAPLAIAIVAPELGCAVWCLMRGIDPVRATFAGTASRNWGWAAALGLLSMLSLVGLGRANQGDTLDVSIAAACVALVLTALAIILPDGPWTPPRVLLLMTAVVMAGWQVPLRGGWLAGGDLPHEYYTAALAISQGRLPLAHYHDSYGWMLSLTAWPALWHVVAGFSLLTVFGILPEIALACCVLVTWGTVRERVGARMAAAICALFVVTAPDLVSILPLVSRQCYALVFLALLVFSIATTRLSVGSARVLALVGVAGTAITHYSTAFVAAAALVCAWGCSYALRAPVRVRVLTMRVAAGTAAAVALWDVLLAGANSNLSQLAAGLTTGPGSVLPPVAGPGVRCTVTGAQAASFVRHGANGLGAVLAGHVALVGAAASGGPLTWVVGAVAIAAVVVLAIASLQVVHGNRSRRWVVTGSVALASMVALGMAGIVRAAGLHRVGQLFSRPFTSPAVTPVGDVARLRADDLITLTHSYFWMRLADGSCGARLVSFAPPTARGITAIGSTGNAIELLASKAVVALAVVSVAVCVWAAIRDKRMAGLAGLGVAGVATAAAWKLLPAMAQYFGTDRIQVETYLIFAATSAAAVQWIQARRRERGRSSTPAALRIGVWVAVGLIAAVAMAGSVGLVNFVTPGRPLDAAFSSRGQQVDLSTSLDELPAAQWLVRARPKDVVQADFTSLGALGSVGYADRYAFIPSVDPVLTDERAWVFASRTNLLGRAYGGSTTYKAAFRFPISFLEASRPTLFSSNAAVVFGASAARRRP